MFCVSPDDSPTRAAKFDLRTAYFTFHALERTIIEAVEAGELDLAAEYTDTLLILVDQLDEFHDEFRAESDRLAGRDARIERDEERLEEAIATVRAWVFIHDHPAKEWFEGGEGA